MALIRNISREEAWHRLRLQAVRLGTPLPKGVPLATLRTREQRLEIAKAWMQRELANVPTEG